MPIVPFLTDSEENLEAIIRSIHAVKADFAGMTLRDQQALYFFSKLKEKYPELVEKFQTLYQGNYVPKDKDYVATVSQKMVQLCKKYSVNYRIKQRWIPSDYRRVNYLVAQELADHAYELQLQGKIYNHYLWAANHINNLTQSITILAQNSQLETIQNVKGKIRELIERLIKKHSRSRERTLESFF